MEWSDVRIFLAVMRGGSYGEAARTLGVSHPTVGRRIKALEDAPSWLNWRAAIRPSCRR